MSAPTTTIPTRPAGAPAAGAPRLALFDLDHTLLPIDSDYAWGEFTCSIGWVDAHDFRRRNDAFFEQYRAGTLDIADYTRFATAAFVQRGAAAAAAAHARFMQSVIAPALRPQARALLQAHRDAGEQIVIITATNEFVTGPIAHALGVDELIALRLRRDASGWYTGEIDGVPSAREGKVTRMSDWLRARGLGWEQVQTTFYSDSINDLPLLEKVTRPVATNPDARLRAIALERGWRILDLFG